MDHVNRKRLIKTFLDLVKIPSPSWREKGIIDYVTASLKSLGIRPSLHACGESHNLLARLPGNNSRRPVLFVCHMDTVVPCERVVPVMDGEVIRSDGGSVLGGDDKAAVAAFLEALRVVRQAEVPHGPLEFLFTCAEEIGLRGIKCFDLSILKSRHAFVFDSGGDIGKIVLTAPTQVTIDLFVKGKAAHAGMEPEKGVSAIRTLAEILGSIPHGRIDAETTANIGLISGGKATNIVAEDAFCRLEVRSLSKRKLAATEREIKRIAAGTARRLGASIKMSRQLEYHGFSMGRQSELVRMAGAAIRKMGAVPRYESSGGGSDTNIINRAGIKAVNLSVGMRNVHTTEEYIRIGDLVDGARLVLAIIDEA